jgi:hypothetical protein
MASYSGNNPYAGSAPPKTTGGANRQKGDGKEHKPTKIIGGSGETVYEPPKPPKKPVAKPQAMNHSKSWTASLAGRTFSKRMGRG